jgi:hypothetical protein
MVVSIKYGGHEKSKGLFFYLIHRIGTEQAKKQCDRKSTSLHCCVRHYNIVTGIGHTETKGFGNNKEKKGRMVT